ncbi:conserved exported hypothetical protein [Candidatus Sulfotelmatobacter sp. SbA7]|jgi:uncharacterized repeat protein (TIGR03803 family)|nr:conserved exported hypothetical protein [Candidatus Sulfotelmatobacter sp. SbA7]
MTSKRLLMAISKILIASIAALILVPGCWAITSGKEYKFKGGADGANPQGGLVSDGAGNFYGTTIAGGRACSCGTVFKTTLGRDGSWQGSVIYKFKDMPDGASPSGNLVFDSAGNLYGTTTSGGLGSGTVFELSPAQDGMWTESVIYSFDGDAQGSNPTGVVFDSAGNLYGTNQYGPAPTYVGTVFELTPGQNGVWTENTLYTFPGGQDGAYPNGVVFDSAGNLFGTTVRGGNLQGPCGGVGYGCGTVFELTPSQGGSWTETILYSFNDSLDGAYPSSGVIFDTAGNLYGEAPEGGSLACPGNGCGVIFKLTPGPNGWSFSIAHTFNGFNGSKGEGPAGGLVFDSAGNMYGATFAGGGSTACNVGGCGTIFKLSPKVGGGFTFSMIGGFNETDGWYPFAGVIVDTVGNLYGTTVFGGNPTCNAAEGCGVVFEITP